MNENPVPQPDKFKIKLAMLREGSLRTKESSGGGS
jgi:hypothetical protein